MSVTAIADAISAALPSGRPISHHAPCINGKESSYVDACLKGGIAGDYWVKKLEDALAAYCNVENVIGTASGTAALHVALMALGVEPGQEVLVPTLTFSATANAVKYAGAVPHFVDGSLGINAFKLRQYLSTKTEPNPDGKGRLNPRTGRVISALIVVDLLGFPADLIKLSEVAGAFGLLMIEDAAQALGAYAGNRRCGSFGDAAIISFNNNKIVTGNGGGALLTNNPWVAAKAHQLATTARVKHPWLVEHDALGFNYRLNNLNAALALAQFEQLDDFIIKKRALHQRYTEVLSKFDEIKVLQPKPGSEPNYWLTTLMLEPKHKQDRDQIFEALHARGIQARALFTPLDKSTVYADCPRDENLLYAHDTFSRAICLPSGVGLV